MHADVIHLVAESGPLLNVSGMEASPDRFSSLKLEFSSGVLHLRCDDDTDEIIAEISKRDDDYPNVVHPAIRDMIGLRIDYAWSLTNHRGYVDAFQLRLEDGTGTEKTFQFEVLGSAMDVLRVVA